MMTDEQRQHAVAAIQQALPALEWTLQPAKIKRLSRDFHWFSPLLTEQLAGKQADAVVRPRDEEELRQLVCACAQHQLPLTLRGSATGNYGQLVPLEGGLLVDMTGLNQIVALGNGTVRAQAGIRLADIETAAHAANIPLEVLHRVAAMASGGMDTLPHNGAVITLLAITGLSHRQAYGGIFAITVIKSLAVLFVIATFYVTGIV